MLQLDRLQLTKLSIMVSSLIGTLSWGKSSSNRHYTIRLTKFDKFSAATLC